MTGGATTPHVSVGLFVRNGADIVERCIESVLAQDFTDLELVVSDNASDDETPAILARYAEVDQRVRTFTNPKNIGLLPNANRVFDLARGRFFRWISADDWLEPTCLSTCIDALEARPSAIGVTTNFRIQAEEGKARGASYRGEFPDSPDPVRRLARMLWFFHAGDALYDPIYGVFRRSALERTPRNRVSEHADWLLASELALAGPIVHVHQCLANRTRTYKAERDRKRLLVRLHPDRADEAKSSALKLQRDLMTIVRESSLSDEQVLECKRVVRRFTIDDVARRGRDRIRRAGAESLRRVGFSLPSR